MPISLMDILMHQMIDSDARGDDATARDWSTSPWLVLHEYETDAHDPHAFCWSYRSYILVGRVKDLNGRTRLIGIDRKAKSA